MTWWLSDEGLSPMIFDTSRMNEKYKFQIINLLDILCYFLAFFTSVFYKLVIFVYFNFMENLSQPEKSVLLRNECLFFFKKN